jgi:phosphoribosylaminoimidazolecarboxamide formyltransferase/IMP cyclohydrolase
VFAAKQNVRLLEVPLGAAERAGLQARGRRHAAADADSQERGAGRTARGDQAPGADRAQMDDLLFAWKVAKFVKSNAIVFCAAA